MTCTSQVSSQQPFHPQVREEWSVSAWVDQEGNAKHSGWPRLARKRADVGILRSKGTVQESSCSLGLFWLNVAASGGAGAARSKAWLRPELRRHPGPILRAGQFLSSLSGKSVSNQERGSQHVRAVQDEECQGRHR